MRPAQDEYALFYHGYVALVPEGDIVQILRSQQDAFQRMLSEIPPEKESFQYAEGKWTVKQVVQHIIDAERVFAYRMMSFSRGEATPLPGFDENAYARAADAAHRALDDLIREFEAVREASVLLLRSLRPEDMGLRGTASGSGVTVRGLAYIIAGHCAHHMVILRERYTV